MLNVLNISKSYGPKIVLSKVSFGLHKGMRLGLVGINGVGKSTLLKILAGLETADSGQVIFAPSTTIGYVPQNLPACSDQTLDGLLLSSMGELRDTEARLRKIEHDMATAAEDLLSDLLDEYGRLSARLQEAGGYEIDFRIKSVLEGLEVSYLDRSRKVDTLSGGEKTRINLAGMLLTSPDLLLLDEPTNNLDNRSLKWLETYLSNYKGALIVASHDREFLNNVVTGISEIDEHTHQIKKYTGNYDAFKLAKDAERAKWEEDYRNQQEEIKELKRRIKSSASSIRQVGRHRKKQDKDKFIPYFKGQRRQESVSRSVRDAEERLKRIQANLIPRPPGPLRFKAGFISRIIKSAEAIRAIGVSKSYGTRLILRDITFSLLCGSRVVITGPNGVGNTTLLRILTSGEKADKGEVAYAPEVRIGFLPQEAELNDPEKTIMQYYSRGLTGYEEEFIFGLVTCGLFRYGELNKKVGQLSLGQARKLQIAHLIATEPNVLILDEPNNHLSLDVLESFESAIAEFQGPVIAVSHDRRFIRNFSGEV